MVMVLLREIAMRNLVHRVTLIALVFHLVGGCCLHHAHAECGACHDEKLVHADACVDGRDAHESHCQGCDVRHPSNHSHNRDVSAPCECIADAKAPETGCPGCGGDHSTSHSHDHGCDVGECVFVIPDRDGEGVQTLQAIAAAYALCAAEPASAPRYAFFEPGTACWPGAVRIHLLNQVLLD